jgi:uncharacterized protein YijF (DUF1287 family)
MIAMSRRALALGLAGAPAAAWGAAPAPFNILVARGAEARTLMVEIYDPSYVRIGYPMGDVPDDRGVCADTVIRAFRAGGADLQQLVHEDMARAFAAYPHLWGLDRPDPNIDHRRVPNLETFFRRAGAALAASDDPALYAPGDVVSWRIPGNLAHIGVVSTRAALNGRPLMVHNIGAGSQLEDVLFAWKPVGWFRYRPAAGTR